MPSEDKIVQHRVALAGCTTKMTVIAKKKITGTWGGLVPVWDGPIFKKAKWFIEPLARWVENATLLTKLADDNMGKASRSALVEQQHLLAQKEQLGTKLQVTDEHGLQRTFLVKSIILKADWDLGTDLQNIPKLNYRLIICSHNYGYNLYDGDDVPDSFSKMRTLYDLCYLLITQNSCR